MLNSFFDKYIFTNNLKYTHNNFYLVNIPFLIVPVEVITSAVEVPDAELHKKIYEVIKKNVKSDLMRQFDIDFGLNKEKALELLTTFFTASGWGKIQMIDLDFNAKRAILLVENSPVAAALKGKVSWPVDAMLRGIFAGIFSNVFGIDVDCVESECAALNSPNCKFIIKPQSEFDLSTKEVRDQLVFE
ncbi:MAG: hypothetical protein NTZ73_03635 [Candidatus Diapherotrites archaeon]|nr:hypothetical protein [Candidatus Diapherotrites archaeon]